MLRVDSGRRGFRPTNAMAEHAVSASADLANFGLIGVSRVFQTFAAINQKENRL